jgi:hypothetical protein
MEEDTKPAALSVKPEEKLNDSVLPNMTIPTVTSIPLSTLPPSNLLNKMASTLPPKILSNTKPISNEDVLKWLEKQDPTLADSFANDFRISTSTSTRLPRPLFMPLFPTNTPSMTKTPIDINSTSSTNTNPLVDSLVKQYQELNEEGQKDLWLGALASNDKNLIQALTNIHLVNNTANSQSQLAKLTKDLLTHSEKHKVMELKYEDQAGKQRLYFHNWLTRLSAVIKMFSQMALVLDVDNNIVEFDDPNCIGNQDLYVFLCSKVDNFHRNLIQRQHNLGDKALSLLKSYCAGCTIIDKNHFHREFTNLRIQNDETAMHFLNRFTMARTKAIIADNEYLEDEVVDLFLAAFTQTKNIQYMYVTQNFLSMCVCWLLMRAPSRKHILVRN